MRYYNNFIRLIIFSISIAFLACSSSRTNHYYNDDSNLTPRRAMNINWNNRKISLTTIEGDKLTGYLKGWDTNGFILSIDGKLNSVDYNQLRNYMAIQTGDRNNKKGAYYGFYSGLGLAAINGYLILNAGNNNKNSSSPPDPPPINDNVGAQRDIRFAIITAPIIVAVSTGIGSFIGGLSHKYKKYYFRQNEFAKIPYLIEKQAEPPIDNFKLDNR